MTTKPLARDLEPLLANPFPSHTYPYGLAERILINDRDAGGEQNGDVDYGYHHHAVLCYGTALYEYLVSIGVYPGDRTVPSTHDDFVSLAYAVKG